MTTVFENFRLSFSVVLFINICFGQYVPYHNFPRAPYLYPYRYTYPSIQQKYYHPHYQQVVPTYYRPQYIPNSKYINRYEYNNKGFQNAFQPLDYAAKLQLINQKNKPKFKNIYNVYTNKKGKERINKKISVLDRYNLDDDSVESESEADENYRFNEQDFNNFKLFTTNNKKEKDKNDYNNRATEKKVNKVTIKKPENNALEKIVSKADEVVLTASKDEYKKSINIDINRPNALISEEINNSDENNFGELNDYGDSNEYSANDIDARLIDSMQSFIDFLNNSTGNNTYKEDKKINDYLKNNLQVNASKTAMVKYILKKSQDSQIKNLVTMMKDEEEPIFYIYLLSRLYDIAQKKTSDSEDILFQEDAIHFYEDIQQIKNIRNTVTTSKPNIKDGVSTVFLGTINSKINDDANRDKPKTLKKQLVSSVSSTVHVDETATAFQNFEKQLDIETTTSTPARNAMNARDSKESSFKIVEWADMIPINEFASYDIKSNPATTAKPSTTINELSQLDSSENYLTLDDTINEYYVFRDNASNTRDETFVTYFLDESELDSSENYSIIDEASAEIEDRLKFMNYLKIVKDIPPRIEPISWDIKPQTGKYAQICFLMKKSEVKNLEQQFPNDNPFFYKSLSVIYGDHDQVLPVDKQNYKQYDDYDRSKDSDLSQQFGVTNPVIYDYNQIPDDKLKSKQYNYFPFYVNKYKDTESSKQYKIKTPSYDGSQLLDNEKYKYRVYNNYPLYLDKSADKKQYQIMNAKMPIMYNDGKVSGLDNYNYQPYKLSIPSQPKSVSYYNLNKNHIINPNHSYKVENFNSKNHKPHFFNKEPNPSELNYQKYNSENIAVYPKLSNYPFYDAENPMWEQNGVLNHIKQTKDETQQISKEKYQYEQRKKPQYIQQDFYNPKLNFKTYYPENNGVYPETLNNVWDYLTSPEYTDYESKFQNIFEYNSDDKYNPNTNIKGNIKPTSFLEDLNQQLSAKQKNNNINNYLNDNILHKKYTETYPSGAINAEDYEYLKELSYLLQNQPNYKTYPKENIGKYNSGVDINKDIIHQQSNSLPYDQGLKKNHYNNHREISRAKPLADIPESNKDLLISSDLINHSQEVKKENREIEEYPEMQENKSSPDFDMNEDVVNYIKYINDILALATHVESQDLLKDFNKNLNSINDELRLNDEYKSREGMLNRNKESILITEENINKEEIPNTYDKVKTFDETIIADEKESNYNKEIVNSNKVSAVKNENVNFYGGTQNSEEISEWHYKTKDILDDDEPIFEHKGGNDELPVNNEKEFINDFKNSLDINNALHQPQYSTVVKPDDEFTTLIEEVIKFNEINKEAQSSNIHDVNSKNVNKINSADKVISTANEASDALESAKINMFNDQNLNKYYSNNLKIMQPQPSEPIITDDKFIESHNYNKENYDKSKQIKLDEQVLANLNIARESDLDFANTNDKIINKNVNEARESSLDLVNSSDKIEYTGDNRLILSDDSYHFANAQPEHGELITPEIMNFGGASEEDTTSLLNNEKIESEEHLNLNANDSSRSRLDLINTSDESNYTGDGIEKSYLNIYNDQNDYYLIEKSLLSPALPEHSEKIITDDEFTNSDGVLVNDLHEIVKFNGKLVDSDEKILPVFEKDKNYEDIKQSNVKKDLNDEPCHLAVKPKHSKIITDDKFVNAQGAFEVVKVNGELVESDEKILTIYDAEKNHYPIDGIKESNRSIYEDQNKYHLRVHNESKYYQLKPDNSEIINSHGTSEDNLNGTVNVEGEIVESGEKNLIIYNAEKMSNHDGDKNTVGDRLIDSHGTVTDVKHKANQLNGEVLKSKDETLSEYDVDKINEAKITKCKTNTSIHQNSLSRHSELIITDEQFINSQGDLEEDIHETIKVNGEPIESEEDIIIHSSEELYDEKGFIDLIKKQKRIHTVSLENANGTVMSPQLRRFLAKFHDCFGFYPGSVSNGDILALYFEDHKILGDPTTTTTGSSTA